MRDIRGIRALREIRAMREIRAIRGLYARDFRPDPICRVSTLKRQGSMHRGAKPTCGRDPTDCCGRERGREGGREGGREREAVFVCVCVRERVSVCVRERERERERESSPHRPLAAIARRRRVGFRGVRGRRPLDRLRPSACGSRGRRQGCPCPSLQRPPPETPCSVDRNRRPRQEANNLRRRRRRRGYSRPSLAEPDLSSYLLGGIAFGLRVTQPQGRRRGHSRPSLRTIRRDV